jgi:hypothetical protein
MNLLVRRTSLVAGLAAGALVLGMLGGAAAASDPPTYKPPPRGAPSGRVGLGTRSIHPPPQVWALAPDHTGLTTRDQPSLYWYVLKPVASRIEITAFTSQGIKTLLDESVASPVAAGVQRMDLARYGVRLEPGVEYRWSVSLEGDPKQRSNSVAIEFVAASPALAQRIASTPRTERAAVYAGEGIWYDAIAALGELIEQSPNDAALRMQRAALLEQVGLKEAAAGDKRP